MFIEACDQLIANNRSAPMLKEISAAVAESAVRSNAYRMGGNAFANVLEELAGNNTLADKELVSACMALLRSYFTKQITSDQFQEGCNYLEQVAALNTKRIKANGY